MPEKKDGSLLIGLLGFELALGGIGPWLFVVSLKTVLYTAMTVLLRDFWPDHPPFAL